MSEAVLRFPENEAPLFLVWGPPSYGPRSKLLAKAIGAHIEFVHRTQRRGFLASPAKYLYQTVRTLRLLRDRRPGIVFVQNPPSFLALLVWMTSRGTGRRIVVDSHSDAFQSWYWTRPRLLYRALARGLAATVVTNDLFADLVRSWGGTAVVLQDIPARFPDGGTYSFDEAFNVTVVNTFADDEPLAAVMSAAGQLDDVRFHVTGNTKRAERGLIASAPPNVTFTGFLTDEDYFALLRGSDAVMCLTTRDNTMQRGACEALSLGRPIVTSDWPILRSYFSAGTVHVDNTVGGIKEGVEAVRHDPAAHRQGISALQALQRDQFAASFRVLAEQLGAEFVVDNGVDP